MAYKHIIAALFLTFCVLTHFSVSDVMVTCDLDLPEELHEYLPAECKNLTQSEKMLAIEESRIFEQWHTNLNDYEKSKSPALENQIPEKQWQLRENITNDSMIWECRNSTTYASYYECLTDARQIMIDMLEQYKQPQG